MKEKTLSKKNIYEGRVVNLDILQVELADGTRSEREIVRHAPVAAVLALLDQDQALFVRQYRKAVDEVMIEIPAGHVDPHETGDVLSAARRELEEETGYRAATWKHLFASHVSPGFTDERIDLYLARDLFLAEEGLSQDEDEDVERLILTYDEAWTLFIQGKITDAKTQLAIFFWNRIREGD